MLVDITSTSATMAIPFMGLPDEHKGSQGQKLADIWPSTLPFSDPSAVGIDMRHKDAHVCEVFYRLVFFFRLPCLQYSPLALSKSWASPKTSVTTQKFMCTLSLDCYSVHSTLSLQSGNPRVLLRALPSGGFPLITFL